MKDLRKSIISIGMAALMAFGMAGCAGNPSTSGGTGSANSKKNVTLKALFMKQAGYSESDINTMTTDFEKANPNIKVSPTFVAYEELEPKILTAAKTGGYDVVLGDCIWPSLFAKSGMVMDVTDRVKKLNVSDIYEGALDSTKYNGKYYGIPWLNDVKYLYCNKAMLNKANISNPPKTWDELIQDAKIIKDKGIVQYPIAASWSQAEALICDYTVVAGSFGGSFVDAKNNPTLNSAANKKALSFMYDSLKSGLTNPKSLEMIEDDVLSTFVSGNAAFALNWTYMYNESKDTSKSKVVNDVEIEPVPGEGSVKSATVNGGMPLMITTGCKNPDEAWLYMTYLSSKSVQAKFCKDALPIWKSLYTDSNVISTGGADLVKVSNIQYQYIVNRPQVPYYSTLSVSMQSKLQSVLLGKEDAGKALDDLQSKAISLQNQ